MIQEGVILLCPMGCSLHTSLQEHNFPVDDYKKDEKCPTTTKKTFFAMELKFQDLDTEGEKKKKEERGEDGTKEKTSSFSEGKIQSF